MKKTLSLAIFLLVFSHFASSQTKVTGFLPPSPTAGSQAGRDLQSRP